MLKFGRRSGSSSKNDNKEKDNSNNSCSESSSNALQLIGNEVSVDSVGVGNAGTTSSSDGDRADHSVITTEDFYHEDSASFAANTTPVKGPTVGAAMVVTPPASGKKFPWQKQRPSPTAAASTAIFTFSGSSSSVTSANTGNLSKHQLQLHVEQLSLQVTNLQQELQRQQERHVIDQQVWDRHAAVLERESQLQSQEAASRDILMRQLQDMAQQLAQKDQLALQHQHEQEQRVQELQEQLQRNSEYDSATPSELQQQHEQDLHALKQQHQLAQAMWESESEQQQVLWQTQIQELQEQLANVLEKQHNNDDDDDDDEDAPPVRTIGVNNDTTHEYLEQEVERLEQQVQALEASKEQLLKKERTAHELELQQLQEEHQEAMEEYEQQMMALQQTNKNSSLLQQEQWQQLEQQQEQLEQLQNQLEQTKIEWQQTQDKLQESGIALLDKENQVDALTAEIQQLQLQKPPSPPDVDEKMLQLQTQLGESQHLVQNLRETHTAQLDELMAQLDLVEAEYKDKLTLTEIALNEKTVIVGALGHELAQAQEKGEHLQGQLQLTREAKFALQQRVQDLEAQLTHTTREYVELQLKFDQAIDEAREETIKEAEQQFQHANEMYIQLKTQYEATMHDVANLEQALQEARADRDTLQDTCHRELDQWQQERTDFQHEITNCQKQLAGKEQAIREERESHETLERTLTTVLVEKEALRQECDELKVVCEETMSCLEALQQDNEQLRATVAGTTTEPEAKAANGENLSTSASVDSTTSSRLGS